MFVIVDEEVYEFLRRKAEEEGVSIPAVLRRILTSYFDLQDNTKDYRRSEPSENEVVVGGKKYYRINCKMEKQNEIYIKNELRKREMSVNRLLKELIMVTI